MSRSAAVAQVSGSGTGWTCHELKEDEMKLEELNAELAGVSGVGDALEKENLALAVKFRKGKKEVISRAMKAIDERLRVVLASQ